LRGGEFTAGGGGDQRGGLLQKSGFTKLGFMGRRKYTFDVEVASRQTGKTTVLHIPAFSREDAEQHAIGDGWLLVGGGSAPAPAEVDAEVSRGRPDTDELLAALLGEVRSLRFEVGALQTRQRSNLWRMPVRTIAKGILLAWIAIAGLGVVIWVGFLIFIALLGSQLR
jgi:hypothetical protein